MEFKELLLNSYNVPDPRPFYLEKQMDSVAHAQYNKSVQKILREKYRIGWRKAIATVGYTFLENFANAGNFPSLTAEAVAFAVKQNV